MKNSTSVCADPRAEAAEHRGRIEMPSQVARRRERDGDRGEQHRDECGEPDEFLRALERLPHFGTQVAHGLDPLPGLELVVEPCAIGVERARVLARRDEQAIRRAVAGLQQVGRGNVVDVHEQLGPEREDDARDLGLLLHDRADRERRLADRDAVADLRRRADRRADGRATLRRAWECPSRPCLRDARGSASTIVPRNG